MYDRAAHERRVDGWIQPYLARRQRGEKHPVEDFLFTYYSYSPAQLRRWHPGGEPAPDGRHGEYGRTYEILKATAGRAPHLGCFGLHEWAMVYRTREVRHGSWPLRMAPDELGTFVDSMRIGCSHFDAYRFFTPAAVPLNVLRPTRADQAAMEQPGCLHATMDLYKWAYRLQPYAGSELVADCFELAWDVRAWDMRASPYDLAALGYAPVRIETASGRAEYAAQQREFARRAEPLRERLIARYEAALRSAP